MRLLELRLEAFGPFTGTVLDLSGGREGLHIVEGANEAGKSSALRALAAALYGVPERTRDTFLHGPRDLRVGCRLRLDGGRETAFLRRKGRKQTLLPIDGEPLDDPEGLERALAAVDPDLFRTVYGLDHQGLVRGAEEILAERGEVGAILFGAALATGELRRFREAIDGEADALFRPQASKPEINALLAEYERCRREVREQTLGESRWLEARERLEETRRDEEAARREAAELSRERSRLDRLRRALPLLGRRRGWSERLAAIGPVVVLDEGFRERRLEAERAKASANETLGRVVPRIEALRAEMGAIAIPEALLREAEALEDLHQRLGSHRKAMGDRVRLAGERRVLETEAGEALRTIRPDLDLAGSVALRPVIGRKRQIRRAGTEYRDARQGGERIARKARELERDLARREEALAAAPDRRDPEGLRLAVAAARKAGDLEAEAAGLRRRLQAAGERCGVDLDRLGLGGVTPEGAERLAVPAVETVDRFEREWTGVEDRARALADRRAGEVRRLGEVEERLGALLGAGAVPTPEDLAVARAHRDRGWAIVRRRIEGEDVASAAREYDAAHGLPEAYERSVAGADAVANGLLREAARVQEHAGLRREMEGIRRRLEDLRAEEQTLDGNRVRIEAAWREAWRAGGVDPTPPREMRSWLGIHGEVVRAARELREDRARLEAVEAAIAMHRDALVRGLAEQGAGPGGPDAGIEALLVRGEAVVREVEEANRRRADLEGAVREVREGFDRVRVEAREAAGRLKAGRVAWAEAVRDLGLDAEATPEAADDALEAVEGVYAKLAAVDERDRRIAGIDRDAVRFEQDVRDLAARVGLDAAGIPAEGVVLDLHGRLQALRADGARLEQLQRQVEDLEVEREEARVRLEAGRARMADLRRLADVGDDAALPAAEERSAEERDLRGRIAEAEAELAGLCDEAGIEGLERAVADVDPDGLPGRIEDLDRRFREAGERRDACVRDGAIQERDIEAMHGAKAAEAEERRQAVLARLHHAGERYVRVRLAAAILRGEIERFRAENQDPLLARTGEVFRDLTRGSFEGLDTELDEGDEPVLVGVRSGGGRVDVAGMSDGTRDQLYLALRVAVVERHLGRTEAFPFILDDVLINFDDDRARAALGVLADLSARTQVILYTHHRRIVDLAEGLRPAGRVFIQRLG